MTVLLISRSLAIFSDNVMLVLAIVAGQKGMVYPIYTPQMSSIYTCRYKLNLLENRLDTDQS